jgi:CBS domain-containing protein
MSETEHPPIKFYERQVKDIMIPLKKNISFIDETTDITTVLATMKDKDHLWVMDSTDPSSLLGIITLSDTIAFFSPPFSSTESFDHPDSRSMQFGESIPAEEIMSKKPVTASPEETIWDLLVKMKEHKIKHLPILDDSNQLIGEISLSEIIQEYMKHFNQSSQKKTGETH